MLRELKPDQRTGRSPIRTDTGLLSVSTECGKLSSSDFITGSINFALELTADGILGTAARRGILGRARERPNGEGGWNRRLRSLRDDEADNRSEESEGVVQTARRSHAWRYGWSCLGREAVPGRQRTASWGRQPVHGDLGGRESGWTVKACGIAA